ncbi:general substrate transporter [Leucosporidium creatinivorum]|uniref:General substrate transporter n=1 Tax=Leucosporidium creatinivorum TaxID=106004 RepID=A0A1Y2FJK3_9BASI|nr:general substrate transporter [Leucosporidium creatinivorum]
MAKPVDLSVKESFSVWRKGVFWSFLLSLAVMMESYDMILLNSLYAAPPFQKAYGVLQPNGKYIIPAPWQSGLNAGQNVALIIGILIGAPLVDRFGFKRCMMGGLVWVFAFKFLIFFSTGLPQLLAGYIVACIPMGMFSISAPAFAVEVVPSAIRSYVASYVNLCWVIGHVIGAGVLKASLDYNSEWTYKLPFVLMFAIPLPLAVALFFAPESPYYLARKGRLEEAATAMDRLHAPHPTINSQHLVAHIQETFRIETQLKTGGTYAACFRGTNRRRTEIAIISWTMPALVGYVVQFYATFFFTRAGLPTDKAFALGLGNYCIAFAGGITSWFLQYRFGRRTLICAGLFFMSPLMFLVGALDFATSNAGRWAQSIMLMIWFYFYGSCLGPIPYVIAAEVPAMKLRAKTLALARMLYYAVLISASVLSPYFLQTWNLKGKAAFPAFGFTLLSLIWSFVRLPEMKGRNFEELDILFGLKVPARQFSSYVITEEDKEVVAHSDQ